MVASKMNLSRLMVDFDTDAECPKAFEELRWPDGVTCLRCGSDSISRITTRKQYDCNTCRYRFSVTTGTIFNDSHLASPKWFMAVLLMCEAKKGISANQMKRTLRVAHKTAWYLCHRIREAMADVNKAQLDGTIEVDETYIGGKRKGRGRGNDLANKTMILADSYQAYKGIGDDDTTHKVVNHMQGEYVRGDVTPTASKARSGYSSARLSARSIRFPSSTLTVTLMNSNFATTAVRMSICSATAHAPCDREGVAIRAVDRVTSSTSNSTNSFSLNLNLRVQMSGHRRHKGGRGPQLGGGIEGAGSTDTNNQDREGSLNAIGPAVFVQRRRSSRRR